MSSYGELLEAVGKVREEVARIASLFDGMRPEFVRDRLEELGGIGVGRTHEQRLADVEQRVQMRPALDFHDELGALAKRLEALELRAEQDDAAAVVRQSTWLDIPTSLSKSPAADPSKSVDIRMSAPSKAMLEYDAAVSARHDRISAITEADPSKGGDEVQGDRGQTIAQDALGDCGQRSTTSTVSPSPAALPERPRHLDAEIDMATVEALGPHSAAQVAERFRLHALALERRLAEVEKERDRYKTAKVRAYDTLADALKLESHNSVSVMSTRDIFGLQDELEDWRQSAKRASTGGHGDERHCTCVGPLLKVQADLKSDRDALAAKLAELTADHAEKLRAISPALADEFPFGCDTLETMADALLDARSHLSAVKAASETWEPDPGMIHELSTAYHELFTTDVSVDRRLALHKHIRSVVVDRTRSALRAAATGEKNTGTVSSTVEQREQPEAGRFVRALGTSEAQDGGSTPSPCSTPSPPRPAFALSTEQRAGVWSLIDDWHTADPGREASDASDRVYAWIERLVSEEVARAGSGMVTRAQAIEALRRQRTDLQDGPTHFTDEADYLTAALRAEGEGAK